MKSGAVGGEPAGPLGAGGVLFLGLHSDGTQCPRGELSVQLHTPERMLCPTIRSDLPCSEKQQKSRWPT